MTDDQLNHLWRKGVSVEAIAKTACLSPSSIRSRIKRLRAKEPDAWPVRQAPVPKRGEGLGRRPYQKKRAGRITLTPLPSLSE